MKKTVLAVAGLAAVAGIAAVPMGRVSAATTASDTLSITISDNCAISTTHANGEEGTGQSKTTLGTWGNSNDTLSYTIANGTAKADIGKTTLSVVCNHTSGWYVALSTASDLVSGSDSNDKIAFASSKPANTASNWAVSKGSGAGDSATWIAKDAVIFSGDATDSSTQDVYYSVSATSTQPAGVYTAANGATYTLYTGLKEPAA